MNRSKLETNDGIRNYIAGGFGTFTILNKSTGNRFTYRISMPEDANKKVDPPRFVKVLAGPDNNMDYKYLGVLKLKPHGLYLHLSPKSKISSHAPSFKSLTWLLEMLNRNRELPPNFEFYHEGRCCRCGRKLTTPESIKDGIGPVCCVKQ